MQNAEIIRALRTIKMLLITSKLYACFTIYCLMLAIQWDDYLIGYYEPEKQWNSLVG